MTMCGMAAGFAALFGTPLTSVIFAMEVITVGVMHYSAIVPCIISALVAAGLSQAVGIAPTTFSIAHIPTAVGLENCFRAAVLGVLCAVLGLSAPFAASLGMAAVFCGVTNCPLASIMLCIEVFGFHGMAYYALCCAVSYMLSGYYGLYTEQKIMYSKVEPEFINKNVH